MDALPLAVHIYIPTFRITYTIFFLLRNEYTSTSLVNIMADSNIPTDIYSALYGRCLDNLFGADNPGPLLGYDCEDTLQDIEDEIYLTFLEEQLGQSFETGFSR